MRMIIISLVFIVFSSLVLMTPVKAGSISPTFRIAYTEFYPFHWTDKTGKVKGIFHDILTESLEERMGFSLIWTNYPWARCQENLINGKDDAIITVPTQERQVYAETHAHPIFIKPMNLFTYVNHPKLSQIMAVEKINDLKKRGFSVITYSGNGWHKKHIESVGIKTYESPYIENIWYMLSGQRGDLIIEWPFAAFPDIHRLNLSGKVLDTGIILSEMPFHFLIRKGHPRVSCLPEFDEIIQDMQASGVISTILKQYK